MSNGTTIAEQYVREGIKLRAANMDRVNGWAEVLQRLGDSGAKILTGLFVHQRRGRLVETLPGMQLEDPESAEAQSLEPQEVSTAGCGIPREPGRVTLTYRVSYISTNPD